MEHNMTKLVMNKVELDEFFCSEGEGEGEVGGRPPPWEAEDTESPSSSTNPGQTDKPGKRAAPGTAVKYYVQDVWKTLPKPYIFPRFL